MAAQPREVLVRRAGHPGWRFDLDSLTRIANDLAAQYQRAEPFPHLVLDGIFPEPLLDDIFAQFPAADDPGWIRHSEWKQKKLQWADCRRLPQAASDFVGHLQSASFIDFLQRLAGIDGLIPDPNCFESGLHAIEPGGFLKIHSDQTFQADLWLRRRVNVIVFLNRDWKQSWGGGLEFWDEHMTRCVTSFSPDFNRTVIFSSQPGSNHGHPDPIAAPSGTLRRSVALYYYTSPENPGSLGIGRDMSQVRTRRRERFDIHHLAADFAPPAVLRTVRRFKNRFTV